MQQNYLQDCHDGRSTRGTGPRTNANQHYLRKKNEQGVIKLFTTDDPVFPDDVFVSTISASSSSEGYRPGSSWQSDCTWRTYYSMRDDLPTLFETPIRSISQFVLPEGTWRRSQGLSQPQMSSEFGSNKYPVYLEESGK